VLIIRIAICMYVCYERNKNYQRYTSITQALTPAIISDSKYQPAELFIDETISKLNGSATCRRFHGDLQNAQHLKELTCYYKEDRHWLVYPATS
jgi:hypothetical protein